jgi:hypothetical protein
MDSDISAFAVQSFRVRLSCGGDADVRQIEFDELTQNGRPVANSVRVETSAALAARVSESGFVAKQMCCACGGGQAKKPNASGTGLDTSKWTADFAAGNKIGYKTIEREDGSIDIVEGISVMYTPNVENVHVNRLHGSLQLTALKNKNRECTPDSPAQQFEQFETTTAPAPGAGETTPSGDGRRRLVTAPRGQPSLDATGMKNQFSYYAQLGYRTFQSNGL